MQKTFVFFLSFLFFAITINAQDFNIGVRAGLNYSKFKGPAEEGDDVMETFGYSNGFHFGINYSQNFTDIFSLRGEIVYIQNGGEIKYSGDSYYIITLFNGDRVYEKGYSDMVLDVSSAYISVPVNAVFRVSDRWEVYGGMYANMLVGPTARGQVEFTSYENPDEIIFRQSLDYQYNSDEAGRGRSLARNINIIVNDDIVTLPKLAGAYYQYDEKRANKYNFLDIGASIGVSYYFNRGFYAGIRYDYGLSDLTNTDADRALKDLDSENNLIYRDDKDTHTGIQVSFGFKF